MKSIGQDTGKSFLDNGREAREILGMLCSQDGIREAVTEYCGERAANFVEQEVERSNATVTHYSVTGKQLFWLRDIKDKLIEKGIL